MIGDVLSAGFAAVCLIGGGAFLLVVLAELVRAIRGPQPMARRRRRKPPNLMHQAYAEVDAKGDK
jgi:hypothetical protein